MRRWLLVLAAAAVLPACGATSPAEVDWTSTPPISGTVTEDGWARVSGPGTHPLVVVASPAISDSAFTLLVPIEFSGVSDGYLEMWSVFSDGSRFFSRTLGTEGGLAAISGDGARTATLPFDLGGAAPPVALELNVVMAAGVIDVGPISLASGFALEASASDAWWGGRTAGWLGAIVGVVLGSLGAWLGRLAAHGAASRARAAAFVGSALAVGLLVAGLIAVVAGQPYVVFYPLLLGGAIGGVLFGMMSVSMTRRIRADELRRVRAADLSA